MTWNHRASIVAMGVTIQPTPGVFNAPGAADLMAVATPNNTRDPIVTDDPTASGTIWQAPRILLGKTGTAGATFPLRGPGGADVPAANAWPFGRILQSAGYTEIRNTAEIDGVLAAGSTTTALRLAAGESAVDDFFLGAPIQHADIGSGPIRGTSIIMDYLGATKDAILAELLDGAPAAGSAYTIPKFLSYVLGTLTSAPPLLSVSVWRDKRRYDYMDVRPTSITFDIPVGNEYNTGFPSCEFALKGKLVAADGDTTPAVPAAVRAVPIPPAKAGKFVLDRVPLGHGALRFTQGMDVGAPSNQNQDEGIDGYEIMSGQRTLNLDLNQMDVSDFDFEAREDAQTIMPALSMWGAGAGNRFGWLNPGVVIDPLNVGERNGFVSLTGDAHLIDVDKSAALAIWGWA